MQRAGGNPAGMTARESLELATLGGASVLGRDDIGALAPGMSADLAAFRIDTPAFAGAQHDVVAALVLCASPQVDLSMINGRVVVKDGALQTVDLPVLVEQHNAISAALIRGEL
jgi:cytosine/adenosine deaminase-related metal-dependent hydrolase